jgi:cell division protein FtsI (penicillin-binding protein 3)
MTPPPTGTTFAPPPVRRLPGADPRARQSIRRPLPGAGRPAAGRHTPGRPARPLRVGDPRRRHSIVATLTLLLLLVFAARLVQIQVFDSAALSQAALESRLHTSEITVPRADIVDRNGVVLATSVDRYNVTVNQQEFAKWTRMDAQGKTMPSGAADAAAILAPILGLDEASVATSLGGDRAFAYVAKNVSVDTWNAVSELRIAGIGKEATSERVYPNGNVAGNVVGFVGGSADTPGVSGLSGLEYQYQDLLLGQPGTKTIETNARGNIVIPTGVQTERAAIPGSTLVTTLNIDLQYYAQTRLDKAVADTGAEWGSITVMDVATGEVYVLADSGAVDPNDPGASATQDRGSRAASAVFEPGSTGKIVTMAALLEEGLATPTTPFTAPYQYTTPNGQTFHDSHAHRDMRLTLTGVLAQSSNTGTVIAGSALTPQQRYDYLSAFGFGQQTGVGLPGESKGILHDVKNWDGRTKYAVLFGQGVSVTALQTAQVYATIANGGVRVQPTVVKGFTSPDGAFVPRETAEPTRVISEETSAQLLSMLESVVDDGTGTRAQVPGYRVAGKTGTAQAASPDGLMSSVVASFVGVAPADQPRIVVSVMLYNPKTSQWGGTVAGPVFSDVMGMALQSLGIPPSGTAAQLYPTTWR